MNDLKTQPEHSNVWYKQNKCRRCRYESACAGIQQAAVRESCTERQADGTIAGESETPRWGEMSYNRNKHRSEAWRIAHERTGGWD